MKVTVLLSSPSQNPASQFVVFGRLDREAQVVLPSEDGLPAIATLRKIATLCLITAERLEQQLELDKSPQLSKAGR